MQIILGLFSLSFALASAFCAGRASALGRQMADQSADVLRNREDAGSDSERLESVAKAMSEIGEGPVAKEYAVWVQQSYIWGGAAVIAFIVLLIVR
jgi:hypothetical protein